MNDILTEIAALTDDAIRQRVLAGDVALFEILIRRYNPVLYRIARGYGFGHHDAEDLMQEAHVSAFENLAQFEGRASYKTWLSRIMSNKCLYKLKYGAHKRESFPGEFPEALTSTGTVAAAPEAGLVNKELSGIIEQSLQRVPAIYRTVFILREVEGLSVAETAEVLGISTSNVKVRLNRSRALLQKEIEDVYSRAEIYSFHLSYCDGIVARVFARIAGP
ncbi:sigma-70 family RNA polymerase sigma factor [Flaviaesturariibacter terrae]